MAEGHTPHPRPRDGSAQPPADECPDSRPENEAPAPRSPAGPTTKGAAWNELRSTTWGPAARPTTLAEPRESLRGSVRFAPTMKSWGSLMSRRRAMELGRPLADRPPCPRSASEATASSSAESTRASARISARLRELAMVVGAALSLSHPVSAGGRVPALQYIGAIVPHFPSSNPHFHPTPPRLPSAHPPSAPIRSPPALTRSRYSAPN